MVLKKKAQEEKLERIKAVIKKKDRQIQVRRNIVYFILKEGVRIFKVRMWMNIILFIHNLETIQYKIDVIFF